MSWAGTLMIDCSIRFRLLFAARSTVPDIFTTNADAGCSSRLQEKCQPGDDPGDDEDWYVG